MNEYKVAGIPGFIIGAIAGLFAYWTVIIIFTLIDTIFYKTANVSKTTEIIGWLVWGGMILYATIKLVGPCPYCYRHIGAWYLNLNTVPGGSFDCPHCKNRVLVITQRFIRVGEKE